MAPIVFNRGSRFSVIFVALSSTFQNLGIYFILPPLNRLIERSICREYYLKHNPDAIHHGDVAESLCKLKPIQSELAALIGLISILSFVNEMLVVIPLGYVSDKLGRKVVLMLNVTGCIFVFGWIMLVGYAYHMFSVRAMIAAPFFYIIGGNASVYNANTFAIIADVSKDITERTAIFGYLQAIGQSLRLVAPALTSFLMTKSLWVPFWVGLGCFSCSIPIILLLPDTRKKSDPNHNVNALNGEGHEYTQQDVEVEGVPESGDGIEDSEAPEDDSPLLPSHSNTRRLTTRQAIWQRVRDDVWDFGQLVFSSRNATLNFAVFLVTTLADAVLNIFLQYVSYRFHWTIAQTGYLLTVKAALSVLLYTVLIPFFLWLLTRRGKVSKEVTDLLGAKVSIVLQAVGVLGMGLSPSVWMFIVSLVIYVLGSGLNLFILSFLTNETFKNINEQHNARLYTAVFLVEAIGTIVGIPIISSAMVGGINIGGYGVGLPFFICAGAYVLASLAIWNLRVSEDRGDGS